jgi:hypothetical protein
VDSTDHVFCNKNCYEDTKEGRRRKVKNKPFSVESTIAEESEDDDESMKKT